MAPGFLFIQVPHKMYHDIKEIYWWEGMKRHISMFVEECPKRQQVKAEHLKPRGVTQSIEIPKWKWGILICTLWLVCLDKEIARFHLGQC